MDELPAAIQDEIWQYVQGDRAYWKQTFQECLSEIRTAQCSKCGGAFLEDCSCEIIIYSRTLDWGLLDSGVGHLRFSD